MAGSIVTTNIVQTLVSFGLDALREHCVMPRIVNRQYERDIVGARRGATLNIAKPAAIATRTVAPDVVPPATTAITPTSISLTLDNWEEAVWAMDDEAVAKTLATGVIESQMSAAIKAMANSIDTSIMTTAINGAFAFSGTSGTTPFSNGWSDYLDARKQGNENLMPVDDRWVVLDPAAEANVLNLRGMVDASYRGDDGFAIRRGKMGYILGSDWQMSQNVQTHTAGTASSCTTDATGYAVGLKTLALASAGTGTILVGDVFTIAGDSQTYNCTSGDADISGGGSISFEPGLKVAIATSTTAITLKADYVANLLIHKDAVAFVSAPLADEMIVSGQNVAVAVDEESGLSLRLEVERHHKQTNWSLDALWGSVVVRSELLGIIAG